MTLRFTAKDGALIAVATLLLAGLSIAAYRWLGVPGLIVPPIGAAVLVLAVALELYRRLNEAGRERGRLEELRHGQEFRQFESLLSLYSVLEPPLPLPHSRGMAASTDLLQKLVEIVLAERPSLVVEASSGVSTVIIAYCLKRLGRGTVISLEHDPKYATISRDTIAFHGLEQIATVLHAPLKELSHKAETWKWYDTHDLKLDRPVDLLVVDGPPGHLKNLVRYPALPVLYDHLSPGATIILDDGARAEEREIASRWQQEFGLSAEYLETENGAYLLRKRGTKERR